MCGLVVLYQPYNGNFDIRSLTRMTHILSHRGPDDYGFCAPAARGVVHWKDTPPQEPLVPGAAMGHRRLSILDLTEAGRQPFCSPDHRYALVYNGEIFNYKELRTELEAAGVIFRTRTDTEVVLAAYAEWGTECFNRFNGMWALVIWDRLENTLVASRDRFGIKPLYFQRTADSWIFASEVKAILAHPSATRSVNDAALVSYVMDLGHPHDGQTFYAGVHAVEPATYILVTPRQTEVQRYWNLPQGNRASFRNIGEAAERLEELLRDSVSLRMRSDVRVGTMLSGGLDSTSVISMVRRLMESSSAAHEATGDTLQAFTAIYQNSDIDEEPLVDELCRSLGVRANKVHPLQEDDLQELLYKSAWHMESPFFNSVPIVHTLLMRKARSVGVKVVLNGHGPDEMFAGYPASYIPEKIGDSISGLRWSEAFREITAMRDVHGLGRRKALQRSLVSRTPRWLRYWNLRASAASSPLLRKESQDLLRRQSRPDLEFSGNGGLKSALCDDFFYQSLPNWLHLEDRISMSESIEARLPFLDYRIVEFAFSLPSEFKIENGVTKRVLREAMKNYLPGVITGNSRKIPFSGPDTSWIRGPLRPWVEQTFLKQSARIFDYFEPSTTKALLKSFLDSPSSGISPYRIWKLVNTEVWLQVHFNTMQISASVPSRSPESYTL